VVEHGAVAQQHLSDGYPYLRVVFSDPGAATFASVGVVLSGGRYQGEATGTAIT
jgi:hypothetical protein